jgi:glycine oxidase
MVIMQLNQGSVLIVGAGVIGCSVAWEFISRGVNTRLIERNAAPFRGSSAASFGSLTPFSDPFFRGDARDFAARSVNLYREKWIHSVRNASGKGVSLVDLGLIELLPTSEAVVESEHLVQDLVRSGYAARVLDVEETRRLEPALQGQFEAALWLDEPWMDVGQYFSALRTAIEVSSPNAFQCGYRVVEIRESSDSACVITDTGEEIKADWIVLCTGLDGLPIDNIRTPAIRWIRGDAVAVYTRDNLPMLSRHIYRGNGFITPRHDGELLLGATYEEEDSTLARERPTDRIEVSRIRELLDVNEAIVPSLRGCEVSRVWRGWRAHSEDGMPILGVLPQTDRIVAASAFIGLGVTMAPAVAEAVVDYCLEGLNRFPPSFDPARFSSPTDLQ